MIMVAFFIIAPNLKCLPTGEWKVVNLHLGDCEFEPRVSVEITRKYINFKKIKIKQKI